MNIAVLVSSFVLLFVAEMGDKTQFMIISLAHRYPLRPVIVAVGSAFLVLNLMAVLVGEALYHYVPQRMMLLTAGGLFWFFAYRSLRASIDSETDQKLATVSGRQAFVSCFTLVFVAELGDKTQLALIALAAGTGELWSVFIGGTLALWTISLIAIGVGGTLLRRIPGQWMHRIAAGLFFIFGVLAIGQALLTNL